MGTNLRRIVLLVKILVITSFVFKLEAQSYQKTPHGTLLDFAPPSPGAASLGKFGDIPVSHCTGIPNISIPIYSYNNKSNGLSLNVSLNYHAGGIRVSEKASNVGLGWALNAGGVITRELRGGPDEGGGGCSGYWYAPALPMVDDYRVNENMYGTTITSSNPYWRFNEGLEDSEPDVFSFQFAGRAGKFIIGKNSQVWVYPHQKIKIEKTQHGSYNSAEKLSFILTAEDGVKYHFDQQENVSSYGQSGVVEYVGNVWHLSKIVAPFETGQIDFSYDGVYYGYGYEAPHLYYKNRFGSQGYRQFEFAVNTLNRGFYAKRLKEISFQNGVAINFLYDPVTRCDVAGDNALKRIEIKDDYTSWGFKLKQNYSFNYNGTESNSCTGLQQKDARLVLHEVIEYAGETEKPPHVISYNTDGASLPDVMSDAQDHWGFFNGAYGNATLLPYNGLPYYSPAPSNSFDNADRRTHPYYAQAGIIKKIKFPTGGFSEFTFESNDVAVGTNAVFDYQQANTSINGLDPNASVLFDLVKPSSFATTQFNFEFGGFSSANSNCSIRVKITSVDGITKYVEHILGPGIGYQRSSTVTLPPGQYKYTYTFESGQPCTSELFVVALRWYNIIQPTSQQPEHVGGLRIKKIVENDGGSTPDIKTRTYEYTEENSSASSGFLAVRPAYTYEFSEGCTYSGMCPGSDCSLPMQAGTKEGYYDVIGSSSLYTLSNSLGSPVLYGRVTEKFTGTGSGSNGKIVRTFSFGSNEILPLEASIPDFFNMPYITPQVPEWTKGQLLSEKIFDASNQLVRTVENQYFMPFFTLDNVVKQHFKGIKVLNSEKRWYNGSCNYYNRYRLNEYFPYSGITQLAKTVETNFVNGVVALSNTTEYTYDPSFYGLTKIQNKDSKENKVEQRLYYPYNYSSTGIHQDMVNANLLAPVVSKEVWREEQGVFKMVGAEITEFGKYNNLLIRPVRQYSFESYRSLDVATIGNFNPASLIRNATYFKPKLELNKYDSRANILEQQRSDDIKKAYLWGYNKSYPVAEVVGAEQATVASFVDQLVLDNPLTTEADMRTELQKVRTGLAGTSALVTTYTYRPLVGVTSTTDPHGRTTFYEYDAFGRLAHVRDKDNRILKKYCYNYQGQPEDCSACATTAANWQTISSVCETTRAVGQAANTGNQILTLQDVNPCSPTYGETQESTVYNPAVCPPPCTSSNCQGEDKKCVNGVCETGCKKYVSSVKINRNTWQCTYVYQFSDATESQQYIEFSSTACPAIGILFCY